MSNRDSTARRKGRRRFLGATAAGGALAVAGGVASPYLGDSAKAAGKVRLWRTRAITNRGIQRPRRRR